MAPPITSIIIFFSLILLTSSYPTQNSYFEFFGTITCSTASRFSYISQIVEEKYFGAGEDRILSGAHLHVAVTSPESYKVQGEAVHAEPNQTYPITVLIHHDCVNDTDRRHMTLRVPIAEFYMINGTHKQAVDIDISAKGSFLEMPYPKVITNYH